MPLPRLVVHFLRRMVRAGGEPDSGDVDFGAGPILGLIAAPGAFQCLMLLDKYSSLVSFIAHRPRIDPLILSIPDKMLFVSTAMTVTGIIVVLKWDRLFPDAQDYTNLAPLPVSPG